MSDRSQNTHCANAALVARRATGEYFTPAPIVQYMVRHTLAPLLADAHPDRPLRILEPACGEGAFLVEAYRCLLEWHLAYCLRSDPAGLRPPTGNEVPATVIGRTDCQSVPDGLAIRPTGRLFPACCLATVGPARLQRSPATGNWELTWAERKRILLSSLFGLELQPQLVERTRTALADVAAEGDTRRAEELRSALSMQIRCGDALVEPDPERPTDSPGASPAFCWRAEFAEVFRGGQAGFDAVLGNPPYVNIRRLTRMHGETVKRYLQQHYRCARGAYDLYVLFLEKAFELLRPGGVCGFIIPNKIATLNYARACRKLLLEQTTILQIVDLAGSSAFPDASVYPYVLIWRKQPPPDKHRIATVQAQCLEELLACLAEHSVRQAELSAESGLQIHGQLRVETRVPTRPLSEVAELHSGSTGFQAASIAGALQESTEAVAEASYEFIVSGNIDRYAIRPGRVRFMKRDFAAPRLPAAAACLTARKRRLFESPKIVIAGLTTRLEAAWDEGRRALGVQVYAAVPRQVDARYLLGLLNSKLLSQLFRLRFGAKRLAGGYLAINKSQLAQLPICVSSPDDLEAGPLQRRLIQLVDELQAGWQEAGPDGPRDRQAFRLARAERDAEIDALVYRLYRLTDEEIAEVEASVQEDLRL